MLSKYASLGIFPLIQEYCPGTGLGQMFLTLNGDVLVEFQHERSLEWPPEGGSSAICRSVPLERHAQLRARRSEEHTSELQSLMRISYAVFCLKKKKNTTP